MGEAWQKLVGKYQRALHDYVTRGDEARLQRAYEFGRIALNQGLGVLDVARLHQEALARLADAAAPAAANGSRARAMETFLLEALSPFEAAHRAFRDTCARLNRLNATLEQRNHELAATNTALGQEIAGRRHAQEQLAEAQRLAHLGSFEWELETNRVTWSDELFRIHGLAPTKGNVSFEHYLARVHPDDRERVRRTIADAIQERRSFAFDRRVIRPDRKVRVVSSRGEVVVGKDGQPIRVVGASQDITERRRAEEMWERYEAIVNTARELLTLIDRNYRYEAVNDAYCRAHGRSRDQVVGRTIANLWGRKAFATVIKQHLDRCFEGEDVHYESWLKFRRMGLRYFAVSYYPFQHQGVVTHAIVVTRDITERKRAEDGLQESEAKYRSVVESAQDGIITADSAGRIVFVNRAAEGIFGYKREELLGRSFTQLVPVRYRGAHRRRLQRLTAGGRSRLLGRSIELNGRRKDGVEFPSELSLSVWRTQAGMFYTGLVRDITARKRGEEALRESKEHYFQLFQQARAMEENLRLLSNKVLSVQEEERKHISRELHDEIGQTLTAVNVSIALFRKEAGRNPAFQKRVAAAQQLLEQTMEAVHRFARELRPAMLDDLGVYPALRSYVTAFSERTGIKVALRGQPGLDRLNGQQGTVLFRVAQESLTNVFKHAQATRVAIGLRRLPRGVCMEIADNGRSFPTREILEGKGSQRLGLLGMQERVRLVDGKFSIESAPGRGTTVRVEIPLPFRHGTAGRKRLVDPAQASSTPPLRGTLP